MGAVLGGGAAGSQPDRLRRNQYFFRETYTGTMGTSEELEKIMNDVMEQIYQLGETA